MKLKYFFLIFISIFIPLFAKKYEYNLVVCSIFKNEAPWLKEWIDYHLHNGVDKFYLYNHMSNDHYLDVLNPYILKGRVELIDWFQKEWPKAQLDAMQDAITRVRGKAKWAAMIDTDEFVVCNSRKINVFLEKYEKLAGLAINWQLFGTSSIDDLRGESLLKNMKLKAIKDYDNPSWNSNRFIKCIIQPNRIKYKSKNSNCGNHIFEPIMGCKIVNEKYETQPMECRSKYVSVESIQINHYWFRDEKWFYDTKVKIREETGYEYDSDLLKEMIDDCNQISDQKILKRLPRKFLGINKESSHAGQDIVCCGCRCD